MNHMTLFRQIVQTTLNGFPSVKVYGSPGLWSGDPCLVWKLKRLCRSTLSEIKSIFLIVERGIHNDDSVIEAYFMDSRTIGPAKHSVIDRSKLWTP